MERVIVEDVTTSPIFAGIPALKVMLSAGCRAVQSTPLLTRAGRLARDIFDPLWCPLAVYGK